MPLELGGRADKKGNQYEINCIICELLKILNEDNYSVVIEPLGEDEVGTDILITSSDGRKEHMQCKVRNSSKEYWNASDLASKDIFSTWKKHLDRDDNRNVSLKSPISCSYLVDLHDRASNTNGDADDFYQYQIQKNSSEFQKFYQYFCYAMDLNYKMKDDILKSIDYLRRILYKQSSEYELEEWINQSIQHLFSSTKNTVYNALVSFVSMHDILGKEITWPVLQGYLENQNLVLRLIDGDKRIAPRIKEMNQEYRDNFRTLYDGFIHRKEFDECIQAIENEQSIIISGSAGYGKSGCTEAILDYCEEKFIPCLAIKLDRRIPRKSCEAWSQDLGFPNSIVYCIDCMSRNEKAVIILDQLDALRWTQTNSSEALDICMELIRQVKHLNAERKKKIIVVFVCRTYDLENDNNIRLLFQKTSENSDNWEIIKVEELSDEVVKKIVGESYDQLSLRLKKLLRIPSNLYIWQHLEKEDIYKDFMTTNQLIKEWFDQICKKSVAAVSSSQSIQDSMYELVDKFDNSGRLCILKSILRIDCANLDFLISSEILTLQNDNVSFVHQTILDYFISLRMLDKYFSKQDLISIIGEKSKQTPSRRYQIQMFLEKLLENDSSEFIRFGEEMLTSQEVRYYVKFIFYEILGQIQNPDEIIAKFIVDNCENEIYGRYLLENVIFSRKQFVTLLNKCGILGQWYANPNKKYIVFDLLESIASDLDDDNIGFIKEHAFIDQDDDRHFMKCFQYDIMHESASIFDLRMLFYEHYPNYAKDFFIDVKSMMKQFGTRTIRLLSFWLKNKIKTQGEYIYRYEEELLNLDDSFLLENWKLVLDEFVPYIPQKNEIEIKYSAWSARAVYNRSIERACVELVKKATVILCHNSPMDFWTYYKSYMGKGYFVFNEIILTGLAELPIQYSDPIICYLRSDLDKNIFDYTSGAKNNLSLVKEVLKIHSKSCTDLELSEIEETICRYIAPDAVKRYKIRIKHNKQKQGCPIYTPFWGDLQYELLHALPKDRITTQSKELLRSLDRNYNKISTRYCIYNAEFGSVRSPVSDKNLSSFQWLKIITNKKLKNRPESFRCIEVENGYIENSYGAYVRSFQTVVSQRPQEMINLVLENKEQVLPEFIEALFLGVEVSEKLKDVDISTINKLLCEFPCDMINQRAFYFCGIIEKIKYANWSSTVISSLNEIALNHSDPECDNKAYSISEEEDMNSFSLLHSKAMNCARGYAAFAIGHLINQDKKWFVYFKDTIEHLSNDKNSAVRFASLYALYSSYEMDSEWVGDRFLSLYESDVRMAGFYKSRHMFFLLYPKYKERITKIIERCFESNDIDLVEMGGFAVCEFYIQKNEFEILMDSSKSKSNDQVKAILNMAILYLNEPNYREKAKDIILSYKHVGIDLDFLFSKMFYRNYIDLEKDRTFLLDFMKTNLSNDIVTSFISFLEENAISLVEYSKIIIQICESVLDMDKNLLNKQPRIVDKISKLIISLYDETANSNYSINEEIPNQCLDLWDIMFERQLGLVREVSKKLMER